MSQEVKQCPLCSRYFMAEQDQEICQVCDYRSQ